MRLAHIDEVDIVALPQSGRHCASVCCCGPYLATLKPEVAAVVCYYGFPREGLDWDLSAVKAAVLGHFAEHDDFAPRDLVERMERELGGAGVEVTFHQYPGTTHAFFNNDRPEVHDAEAAETSWRRTLEFLRARLGGTA